MLHRISWEKLFAESRLFVPSTGPSESRFSKCSTVILPIGGATAGFFAGRTSLPSVRFLFFSLMVAR